MTDFDKKARELADVGYAMRFALIAAALKAAYNDGVVAGGLAAMTASGHGKCDD